MSNKLPRVPIDTPLVKMLSRLTVVQTSTGLKIPAAAHSRNLWYEMATCLFLSSESGFVQDMIISKLSPQRDVATLIGTLKDLKIYRSEISYSLATLPAKNSAE